MGGHGAQVNGRAVRSAAAAQLQLGETSNQAGLVRVVVVRGIVVRGMVVLVCRLRRMQLRAVVRVIRTGSCMCVHVRMTVEVHVNVGVRVRMRVVEVTVPVPVLMRVLVLVCMLMLVVVLMSSTRDGLVVWHVHPLLRGESAMGRPYPSHCREASPSYRPSKPYESGGYQRCGRR